MNRVITAFRLQISINKESMSFAEYAANHLGRDSINAVFAGFVDEGLSASPPTLKKDFMQNTMDKIPDLSGDIDELFMDEVFV